jgi:hypothetical protein
MPSSERSDAALPTSHEGKGRLTVVCYPACDEVFLDKQPLGPSPIFRKAIPAGRHKLTLKVQDPVAIKSMTVTASTDATLLIKHHFDE